MGRRVSYKIDELKALWQIYEQAKVLRVLKDGEWAVVAGPMPSGATRAEVCAMKSHKSFPEWLEGLEA